MHNRALEAMGLERAPARPHSATRNARRWALVSFVPLVAAVASLLLFQRSNVAPLPRYELAVTSQDVASRGAPDVGAPAANGPRAIVSGDRLVLVARPAEPIEGPVVTRVFAVRGGTVREIMPHVAVSDEGAVRIEGSVRELFVPPQGDWDVLVAIGRAGATASLDVSHVADASFALAGWTRVRAAITLQGDPR